MENVYLTPEKEASSEVIEKKSKFIGYAKNVTTEDEALSFINEIKKKHWDARHNVYAYSIKEGNISRCSDDGEPSKTAGAPILDVILKNNISMWDVYSSLPIANAMGLKIYNIENNMQLSQLDFNLFKKETKFSNNPIKRIIKYRWNRRKKRIFSKSRHFIKK